MNLDPNYALEHLDEYERVEFWKDDYVIPFRARHAVLLADKLKRNTSVKNLEILGYKLTDEVITAFSEMLAENTTLKSIWFYNASLQNNATEILARALERNRTIKQLNLGENRIGDEGALALANALKTNVLLAELFLHINSIGPVGRDALRFILPYTSCNIYGVDLRNVDRDGLALFVFMEAETHKTPTGFFLRRCGDRGVLRIVRSFLL